MNYAVVDLRPSLMRSTLPQRGATYELHFLIWPLVYGIAGHAWGVRLGHPVIGTLLGVTLGLVAVVPISSRLSYEVLGLAPVLLLASPWLSSAIRIWYLTGLCLL